MGRPTFRDVAGTSEEIDDRALVERYRAGDRDAFTVLVIRYQRPIFNAAFWILRKAEDASDVSQTVFLKAAEHIDDYDPAFKFFSWIYRMAVNESLNLLRRGGREEALDDAIDLPADDGCDPQERLSAAQRARGVQRALMGMATNDRIVLTLRHFSECSYREMADILELDEKTVKSRLFEARHRLRRLLTDIQG